MENRIETKKFERNLVVSNLRELFEPMQVKLVGGAVLDILNGDRPKDYDLMMIGNLPMEEVVQRLVLKGAEFIMESKFAYTFSISDPAFNGIASKKLSIQIIKRTSILEFPFRIQGCSFNLKTGKLYIDRDYYLKLLTPNNFTCKTKALEQLAITPKYISKGYTIKNCVWESVVSVATGSNVKSNS